MNVVHCTRLGIMGLLVVAELADSGGSSRASDLARQLESAYQSQSKEALRAFFEQWRQDVPIDEAGDGSRAFQHALDIVKDLYQPLNLKRIGDPEWGYDQYANAEYALVPAEIRYEVVRNKSFPAPEIDTMKQLRRRTKLVRFCPSLANVVIRPVCLTDRYKKALYSFLGDEHYKTGELSIMTPATAKGESTKKLDFLNSVVQIYHGHWGSWRLATDPTIDRIQFNSDFTKAVAYFTLIYEGGEAHYKRTQDGWVLESSALTWIT